MFTDPETGELIEPPRFDTYGREYGTPLWNGGPILGGPNWREWIVAKIQRDLARERT